MALPGSTGPPTNGTTCHKPNEGHRGSGNVDRRNRGHTAAADRIKIIWSASILSSPKAPISTMRRSRISRLAALLTGSATLALTSCATQATVGAEFPTGAAAQPILLGEGGSPPTLTLTEPQWPNRRRQRPQQPRSDAATPQDSGRLDRPAYGSRRYSDPQLESFRLVVEGNIGDAELDFGDIPGDAVDTTVGSLDQENDAARMRATAEGYFDDDRSFGAGVTVEGWNSEFTQFGGGSVSGGIDGSLRRFSVTPHFSVRTRPTDRFQIRGRLGPTLVSHELKDNANARGYETLSIGVRVEAEPELFLVTSQDVELSIFGRGTFGALSSFTDAEAAPDPDDDIFNASAVELQATVGANLRIQNLLLTAGYTWERTFFGESNENDNLVVPDVDFGFEGLMFGGGIVF